MGKSKRHRRRKRVEGQALSSSSDESDSDTSEEAMRFNPKRKKSGRPSIIPDDASLDVGNDDLYPAQETRFSNWDTSILLNLEVKQGLGLSQPDKERWDKALDEMILLRSIYNERRRTGRDDIEVPRTPVEKFAQTLSEVEDVGTQVMFEDVGEREPADEELNGENAGGIEAKVEVKKDNPDFNERGLHQTTTVFLDDIEDEDDDVDQSQAVNAESISEEVGSSSTVAPSSSRESKSSESNTNSEKVQNSTCSASEKNDPNSSQAPLTRFQKRKSSKSPVRKSKGHTKSKTPAMEEPIPDNLNGDDETPSTSRSLSDTSRNSEDPFSDGGHMLPSLPKCYRNRKLRVLKGRKCLSEEEFLNTVGRSSFNKAIAICGSTGMGKTTFLAQMGRKILHASPKNKLFYLQMKNVVEAVKEDLGPKTKLIWRVLRRLTREKELGKASINQKATRIELFFDGFDDVQKKDEKLVFTILKCISGSFHSIRMWIATVPYDFKKLEKVLQNAESYSLEPLDYASQVELIVSYLNFHTSEDKSKLLKFVETYLTDLSNCVKNCHLELGNPLQCLLIGAACLKQNQPDYKTSSLLMSKNILDINDNENLLFEASLRKSFHTLELILNLNKFNINSQDRNGDSPLLLSACAKGNVDCLSKLKLLVDKGADLGHSNNSKDNLLLYAARYGSVETLEYILNLKKFDINCVDKYGNTPLFLSADGIDEEGNIDCLPKLKLLIKHKANLFHLRKGNFNLLLYAAQFASAEVFEYILSLRKYDVNSEDGDGNTPLLLSVFQYEGIDCLKKLQSVISWDGQLSRLNKNGINLLHYTAHYGSLHVLKYVINLGKFNINSKDKFGHTALHYARIKDNEEGVVNVDMNAKIKFLTEKGCIG